MIYDWPEGLAGRVVSFNPRGMTVSGPPTLLGRTQIASMDAGYWIASISGIVTVDPETVKAFRAFRAKLEGGAHQARVPVFDEHIHASTLTIETVGTQALRSTLIEVDNTTGLVGGEYFTPVGTDRLYMVREVGTSPTHLVIWPPLREELEDETELDFVNPVCRMRLIDEGSGDLSLDYGRWAFPDMAFVEVF